MNVMTEWRDGVLPVRVSGRIDGSNAAAFDRAVIVALDADDRAVLFDLENLSYINSAGLRTFAKVARRPRRGSGELALCGMRDETRRVFVIAGFDQVMPMYPTRAGALPCLVAQRAVSESTGAAGQPAGRLPEGPTEHRTGVASFGSVH